MLCKGAITDEARDLMLHSNLKTDLNCNLSMVQA